MRLIYKKQKVFTKLPIKYKEILVLKYLEEKDYREMSDILRKPMGTIATLVNRAKQKFKKRALNNRFIHDFLNH